MLWGLAAAVISLSSDKGKNIVIYSDFSIHSKLGSINILLVQTTTIADP